MKPIEITPEIKANHFIKWFEEFATTKEEKEKAGIYAAYVAYQIGQTHPLFGSDNSNFMANFYAKVEKICKDEFKERNKRRS
jgi:hypothetical protein